MFGGDLVMIGETLPVPKPRLRNHAGWLRKLPMAAK